MSYMPEIRDSDPDTSSWGTLQAGRRWYNKSTNTRRGWDGANIVEFLSSLPPTGGGGPSGSSMRFTGFGGDYLIWYQERKNNWVPWGEPDSWDPYLADCEEWNVHFNEYRLGFRFNDCPMPSWTTVTLSDYNYTDMSSVVTKLANIDIKTILNLHNIGDMKDWMGHPDWHDNWTSVATEFAGNDDVAAIQIWNEIMDDDHWSGLGSDVATRYFTPTQQTIIATIQDIHDIDPDRICIFPTPEFQYHNYIDWFNVLDGLADIGYDIWHEPNVIFDIVHPYFFEVITTEWGDWDWGMTPTQKAAQYAAIRLDPCLNNPKIGNPNKIWCGETFYWYGWVQDGSSLATPWKQEEWLTAWMDECISRNIGVDIFATVPGFGGKWQATEPIIYDAGLKTA